MAAEVLEGLLSAEEFLAWESEQARKHELIDNRVYDMTGASRAHNRISLNLAFALANKLGNRGCAVYAMDIRVQVNRAATYTYPDVIVVCGEARFRSDVKPDTLENPTLIFEVLSPATEPMDRSRKFDQYLEIPSLEGYFLVSQDKPRVESYSRQGEGWFYQDWSGLDASLAINVVACELPFSDIYSKLSFEQTEGE